MLVLLARLGLHYRRRIGEVDYWEGVCRKSHLLVVRPGNCPCQISEAFSVGMRRERDWDSIEFVLS